MGGGDQIDVILDQWRRERPDLDMSALTTVGRLVRLNALLDPAVERVFARHGLRRGEFDVLAALRRAGPPFTMIPSELSAALMVSRAGMTNRLDRLEAAGLVERRLDPGDRRSFQVRLTETGLTRVDTALTEHAANMARLIEPLTDDQRALLDDLLRVLLDGVRD